MCTLPLENVKGSIYHANKKDHFGGDHRKPPYPHNVTLLTYTPKEIVEDAVRVWEAGAAAVHIHVRDPETGASSSSLELFKEIVSRIKNRCDVIIGITGVVITCNPMKKESDLLGNCSQC